MRTPPLGRRAFLRADFGRALVGGGGIARATSIDARRDMAMGLPTVRVDAAGDPDVAPFRARAAAQRATLTVPRLARVDAFACLAGAAGGCTVCLEHCPAAGAISLRGDRPTIDADRCDGCGLCERACPAPGRAIRVLPRSVPATVRGGTP